MCTLTWRRDKAAGLEVYFNRDELKTRPVADPPRLRRRNGSDFLSPRDPVGGGTWMLANEHGIIVCLLNRWDRAAQSAGPAGSRRSRGRLVLSMAGVTRLCEIEDFLRDLKSFPAFILVGFSQERERCWEWDGSGLTERMPLMPLTSSSYEFEDVRAFREADFATGVRGLDYHAAAGRKSNAYTVRMCRPDAQTWSRSLVRLSEKVTWEYLAEQPDLDGEPQRTFVELARR